MSIFCKGLGRDQGPLGTKEKIAKWRNRYRIDLVEYNEEQQRR